MMLLRASLAVGIGGALCAAPAVFAKEDKNFYLDYDIQLIHDDHADMETKAYTPTKSTKFADTAFLGFTGTDGKKLSWSFYTLVSGSDMDFEERVEDASVTYKFNKMLSFQVGRQYLQVGGLEWKNDVYDVKVSNAYLDHMPLSGSDTAYTAHLNFGANRVSIQFADDAEQVKGEEGTACTSCYYNSTQKQPAILLEYEGSFGPAKPLVQIVSYDGMNHSRAFTLGVTFDAAGVSGYADYTKDSRLKQNLSTSKEETTEYNSMNLSVAYAAGPVTPFLKYTSFDVVQDGTDLKVNSAAGKFDDNQSSFAIGVKYTALDDNFVPYFMYRSTSGDIQDETKTEVSAETKTKSEVVLGISGSI